MKISFADTRPDGEYAYVVPVAGKSGSELLRGLGGEVDASLARQRFEGEVGSAAEHFHSGRRIVAIGTGDGVSPADAAEKLGGAAVARLLISGETQAVIDLTDLDYDADAAARVALAAALRAWRFDLYRTKLKDKQKPTLTAVTIVGAGTGAADRYASRYAPVVEGVSLTRELVTEPANIIYPESFVERVKASVAGLGLEIEVLDEAAMTALGMGSLLGVSQGSVREAQMLVMRWNGGKAGEAPVALLGKGVTFDTGGISIKPAAGMESMKWDMGGAGAVAGAMKAMSRCAHLTPSSTKRWRNCAAVIDPASRGPTFLMSAIGESISRSYASASGRRHNWSVELLAAASN